MSLSFKKWCLENNSDAYLMWHPIKNGDLTPDDVTYKSNTKRWWRCTNNHEWEAPVYLLTRGDRCPVCSNHRVIAGYNDLATVNPKLAEEWHPTKNGELKPSDVRPGSTKKVWWQCPKGHEWQATIGSRVRGNGCPRCR